MKLTTIIALSVFFLYFNICNLTYSKDTNSAYSMTEYYNTNPKLNKDTKETKDTNNTSLYEKDLTPCVNCLINCQKCINKKNIWEINENSIFKNIKVNLDKIKVTFPKLRKEKSAINKINNTFCYNNMLRYYVSGETKAYNGQRDLNSHKLKGYYTNLRVGLQYGCYFGSWKFYTDDRVILYRIVTDNKNESSADLDIKELYLKSYNLFENRANILMGRKRTRDVRGWWYNNNLDVVQLFNEHDLVTYNLIAGTRLNSLVDTGEFYKNINNDKFFILNINDQFYFKNFISVYFIAEKKASRKLRWVGGRIYGDRTINKNIIRYWLDSGYVFGENKKDIHSYALDIGFLYIPYDEKYSYGIEYALGGKNYSQPLISNNKSNFLNKKIYIKYYGYYLDPTLSNLQIFSLYWFYDLNEKKVFGVSIHNYQQHSAINYIDATRYVFMPSGKNKDIGNEVDVFYKFSEPFRYKYGIVFSYFRGRRAYYDNEKERNGISAKFNFIYYW